MLFQDHRSWFFLRHRLEQQAKEKGGKGGKPNEMRCVSCPTNSPAEVQTGRCLEGRHCPGAHCSIGCGTSQNAYDDCGCLEDNRSLVNDPQEVV